MEFVVEALGAIDETDHIADDDAGKEAASTDGACQLAGSPHEAQAAVVSGTVSPEDARPASIKASAAADVAARIEEAGDEAVLSEDLDVPMDQGARSEDLDMTVGEEGLPAPAAQAESDQARGNSGAPVEPVEMTAAEEEAAPEAAEVSAEACVAEECAALPKSPEDDPELCRVCRTKGGKKVRPA